MNTPIPYDEYSRPDTQEDRDRLNRRIAYIRGSELARELKRYRKHLMLPNRKVPVPAMVSVTVSANGEYWHRINEIQLCHQWLDEHNVPPFFSSWTAS